MPAPKFIVSSRATKGGPTQQVTIPAAIARKLPQGASIRWECSVVKGGLFFKYLGPNAEAPSDPEIELDFVPASDLKAKNDAPARKKKAEAEVAVEAEVEVETEVTEDPATDSTAEQAEDDDEVIEVDPEIAALDEAPF